MPDFNDPAEIEAGYLALRDVFVKAETLDEFRQAVDASRGGVVAAIGYEDGVFMFGGMSGQGMVTLYNTIEKALTAAFTQALAEEAMLEGPIVGKA